jgi:cytidyltransferase-like protein
MALQNLKTYFEGANISDVDNLLSNKCIVTEKIDASSFHVKRDGSDFLFYKSGSKQEMDLVDRTIVRYYENAIRYFRSVSEGAVKDMPFDWKFGFDYLVDNKTVDIEYDILPKSNLILTHIQVLQPSNPTKIRKVIRDTKVLNKWADKLGVAGPPVLFEGLLDSGQKDAIKALLAMSVNEFEQKFEDKDKPTFTRNVFGIFNQNMKQSALMNDLSKDVAGFIVNFHDGKELKSFKLEKFNKKPAEERKPSDMYQITILDIVEHLTQFDFESIQLKEEQSDLRYLELMSGVFNDYVEKNATKYIGAKFDSADFSESPLFELNHKFIQNEKTLTLVQDRILSELFKITLGSFRKKRNKETDIINADLMNTINDIVEKIEGTVMAKTNEGDVMNFNQYLLNQKISAQVSPITEGLTVNYPEQGSKPVNMFVGRFQPFTLGHAKVVETIYKQNGHPVVIFLIKSKTRKAEDAFKRPYDEETQMSMLDKLKSKYPIEKVYILDRAAIDLMFNTMRADGYEPVLWGTGTDRLKTYSYQVDKPEYREDLGVRDDFGLFEIPRTGKNISATQVRNAMLDNDEKMFKKLTPKGIHSMYGELKTKLEDSMGVVAESSQPEFLTFEAFLKNI